MDRPIQPGEIDRLLAPESRACSALCDWLGLFANPVRLRILCRLLAGRACVGELAEATGERQPTVSSHLKHLLLAGLVSREREGNRVYYQVEDPLALETMEFLVELARRFQGESGRAPGEEQG